MASEPQKNKLKTSIAIYNRLLWDDSLCLDKSRIEIVHHDKNQTLKSMAFTSWVCIDQGGDIPFHRIAQFKYNNIILWDRKQRIDNINKLSGHKTLDFHSIQQSIYQNDENRNIDNDTENDSDDNDKSDAQTQHSDTDMTINNNNHIINNDIKSYKSPMEASEFIADSQFISLLKMEPKNVSGLYTALDTMIDDAFITQRPNDVETLARKICIKYLSYVDAMKQHKYCLFGSAKTGLDTHKSDLDIKIIPSKDNKIQTRDQCCKLLNRIRYELSQLKKHKPLHYKLKINNTDSIEFECIQITLDDFTNDENNHQISQLQNRIIEENKCIHQIVVTISSVEVADGAIPRCMILYNVQIISNQSVVMCFKIHMDIIVSIDVTGLEQMGDKHLMHWVNKYCIHNKDKRIHKFLFAVKLWAQHFKVNVSTQSTINGYGWIHIALFLLTRKYKQNIQTDDNNNYNKQEYESMYSDINIPTNINCSKLFILFIDMLHLWICYDELKENRPERITRLGINAITGQWVPNTKQYTLFVLDPFCQTSNGLPGNLAKCVRHKKGIPSLINAIKSTVQQLQCAAGECIKGNNDSIYKHIEFFNNEKRIIINEQIKNANDIDIESDNQTKQDFVKYYTWKQLCNMNLKLPKRKWIQQLQNTYTKSNDDIITICEFNCLSDDLTYGETEHCQFKTARKYLKWNHRSKRILYEILQYKCDIICLCEIQKTHYENFYYPNLSKYSYYDGLFMNKNDPNKYEINNANKRPRRVPTDGVAIFWNTNKFSCHKKFNCILGKPNLSYHVALGVRLRYKNREKISSYFDVWCTHLKAGRNNKAEYWRLAQIKTLLYYMRKYSLNVPILLCGDLNSHFEALINSEGDLVTAKVYPAILNGEVKSSASFRNDRDDNSYCLKFESLWNNNTRNTFSTWAGWKDREVKCCFDYIMIGSWYNKNKKNKSKERMFKVSQLLDVWDEKEIQQFDAKLPNKIYPSDHILIAAKIAIKTD